MASLKALRARITSVKSTRKITQAMKMVAAAKLRRAQEAAEAARPYSVRMAAVMASLGKPGEGLQHALERPVLLAIDAGPRRHQQVLDHRQGRKDASTLGHIADACACDPIRGCTAHRGATDLDLP